MGFFNDILALFKGKEEEKPLIPSKCPHCPEETLKVKEKFGVKIYLCFYCGGSFLTQTCLKDFLAFHEEEDWPELFDLEAESGHTYEKSEAPRNCPACNAPMENVQFQSISGIWIDICPAGHGVWLDCGEIKLIKKYKNKLERPLPPEKQKETVFDGKKNKEV